MFHENFSAHIKFIRDDEIFVIVGYFFYAFHMFFCCFWLWRVSLVQFEKLPNIISRLKIQTFFGAILFEH